MRTKAQILAEIRQLKTNPLNYTESVIRADPYTMVAEAMVEKLPDTKVFEGLNFKQIRALCKKPVMTTFYNSKQQPISVFGEGTPELEAFYATLWELFPGAMNVMEAINSRWDSNAMYHEWTTPDGTVAHVKVEEMIDGVLDNEGLNLPYRYRLNQPSKSGISLPANVIQSLDAFCIRYVADNADFDFSHIHDDFQSHPNNMGKVRALFLDSLKVIAESHFLEEFCGKDFGIEHEDFVEGLASSSYALC